MTRLGTFTIHLTVSATLILAVLGLMMFAWYPAPYFEIDGGWKILSIVAGVNMGLGPLLTLIVFKSGKPGLKFDLICIILMQFGALLYGAKLIYQQRPAFVVFSIDRFITIPASKIDLTQLKSPEIKHFTDARPLLVQAHFPEDPKVRQDLMFAVLSGHAKDIEFHPELYEPYQPDIAQLRLRSIDIKQIISRSKEAKQAVERFITQQNSYLEDYLYLPLVGKNKDIIVVLSSQNGAPAGSINISPWLEDYREKAPTQ